VHGHPEGVVEHAAESESLGRWVVMVTAVLATIDAIVSDEHGPKTSSAAANGPHRPHPAGGDRRQSGN
jgi:hypothetical protein